MDDLMRMLDQRTASEFSKQIAYCVLSRNKTRDKVYFIQGVRGGPIKIGWAADPVRRLDELQVGNPVRLRILGLISGRAAEEARIHKIFSHLRGYGEWFKPAAELLLYIKAHCEGGTA